MLGLDLHNYILSTFRRTDKTTQIYEAITDTIMDIKLQFEFDSFKVEAYSTSISVLGDYKIDVPSDFGHLVGAMRCNDGNGNSRILLKLSKEQFDELYPDPNAVNVSKAMPTHYCLFGEQFLFGNVPDRIDYSYEFSYTTEASDVITASTANVPFSDRYRECLKFGALMRLYAGLDDDEKAAKWKNFYDNEIAKIAANEIQNNSGNASFIRYNDL